MPIAASHSGASPPYNYLPTSVFGDEPMQFLDPLDDALEGEAHRVAERIAAAG